MKAVLLIAFTALALSYPLACVSRAVYIDHTEFKPQVAHFNRLHEYAVSHPESNGEMLSLEWRVYANEGVANCRTMEWPLIEKDGLCGSYDNVPEPPATFAPTSGGDY